MSRRRHRSGRAVTVSPPPTRAELTGRERRAEARRRAEERRSQDTERQGLPTAMVVIAVGAVVALVAGIALYSGFLAPPGGPAGSSPVASLHTLVHGEAADVATIDGSGWVLDDNAGTIRRFDPSSGAWSGHAVHVAEHPVSVAAGFGKLWVADAVGNAVVEVDPATGRRVGSPVSVGSEPVSVATGAGGVWVASLAGDTVSRIDPRTRTVTASVALPSRLGAVRVSVGAGAVWVTGVNDALTRISAKPVGVSLSWRPVVVGEGPIGVTAVPGAVWVADALGGSVSRVDPRSLKVTARYEVGGDPVQVAVVGGELWVGDGQSGALKALDPRTGASEGRAVVLPGAVRRLVATDAGLWAATANPGTVVAVSPR